MSAWGKKDILRVVWGLISFSVLLVTGSLQGRLRIDCMKSWA